MNYGESLWWLHAKDFRTIASGPVANRVPVSDDDSMKLALHWPKGWKIAYGVNEAEEK